MIVLHCEFSPLPDGGTKTARFYRNLSGATASFFIMFSVLATAQNIYKKMVRALSPTIDWY